MMTEALRKSGEPAAADGRQALLARLPVDKPLDHFLENMHDDEQHRQKESLVKDRVDERAPAQPAAWVEHLEHHHHLGEDKRVDEGEALHGETHALLPQDDALVEHENAEQQPQVKEED